MIYAYIIGSTFMEKEFDSMEEACETICKLQSVPHKEKLFWLLSERELTEKEKMLITVIQQEF